MQRRLMQTKIYYNHFYSVSKETFYKPLKVAELQKSLSQVCISLIQLASMSVFILCGNCKTLFFIQTYHYPKVWCNGLVFSFFKTIILKEVRILYSLSAQENAANTIGFKIKLLLLKCSLQNLFLDSYFLSFQFVNVHIFLYKWDF